MLLDEMKDGVLEGRELQGSKVAAKQVVQPQPGQMKQRHKRRPIVTATHGKILTPELASEHMKQGKV